MRWLRVMTATVVTGGLVIAGCGDDDDGSQTTLAPMTTESAGSATTAAAGAGSTTFNDADVEFAQGMIAHHQQAIDMAEMALDPNAGASRDVLELAGQIQAAQDPEIKMMTGWLTAWGRPLTMDTAGGHDMSSMEGMMTAEEMDQLATMSGPVFDTMWTEMMIRHHQGAIAQAETVKAMGSNPEVFTLAEQIIAAQSQEISEMESRLAG